MRDNAERRQRLRLPAEKRIGNMLFHGLQDFVLFALLAVFVLLTIYATVAQASCKRRCQQILFLAAATLFGAGWAGYHFAAQDPLEILDHYASTMLAIVVASLASWFLARRIK